jgi:hypothetical protein
MAYVYHYVKEEEEAGGKKRKVSVLRPVYYLKDMHELLRTAPESVYFGVYIHMNDYDLDYDPDHASDAYRYVSQSMHWLERSTHN